jgi:hypothetical protein
MAREAGVLTSDVSGLPLRAKLNLDAELSWVGYANEDFRSCVEPLLRKALIRRGPFPSPAPNAKHQLAAGARRME